MNNNKNNIIIDYINVKNLPELIVDYLKQHDVKSNINSIRNIYSLILREISYEVEESYLNRLQKYLSSSEKSVINIIEDINDGIYDSELQNAVMSINNEIRNVDIKMFCNEIFDLVHFVHFDDDEFSNLKSSLANNDYDKYMFLLFKHAFKLYKTNTPRILAERLYEDAMCQRKTLLKTRFLKIAGDLGNSLAAFEYAVTCGSLEEQIHYLLKSKDINQSIWQLGWVLERKPIQEIDFNRIVTELSDIIHYSKTNGANNIKVKNNPYSIKPDHLTAAYQVFYYLAKVKNFSKAYNSVGKLLINDIIVYTDDTNYLEFGLSNLKIAASLGNSHAMQNLALYYKKHDYDTEVIKELLYMGAESEELICCNVLSEILMKEGKENEAINFLKHSASRNNSEAQYKLAKFYEKKFDFDNAKYWYKESIKNGNVNSTLDLALVYFQEYIDTNNSLLLTNAITLLKNNLSNFDGETTETANKLISEWTSK